MAKVSANSPESMFSDESKVFRVLVYKPCTRYFVSQSIIRGNKTGDKGDDADDMVMLMMMMLTMMMMSMRVDVAESSLPSCN